MQPVATPRVFSGRYELTHLVARGGMAQVYRAHDRLLDRPVALKVLFPELSVDRAFVERFRREAQAAANLSHPNIVPVFDWGEDGGTYYIVMEFIDGQPLSQALRSGGPMPFARVAQIGAQVADALAYAHRHGVVHRDVKPGNVLLTEDEQVKVTDFGIARALNTEESLTQTGAVMGTASYFSPEQAEGIGVDARSDIYSLGVVLFEMVAGRPPFLGDTPVSIASKHVRDRPPLLRDLNPTVPPALEAIIAKAMAKSQDLRYQSASDLQADLRRFVEGRPVSAADAATTAMLVGGGLAATSVVGAADRTQAVAAGDGRMVTEEEEEESHVGRWLLLILGLVVLLGVVVFLVLQGLGYIGGPGSFSLPTVRSQPVASAKSILEAKGLKVSGTTHRISTAISKTDVISTDPSAGTKVAKGNHVSLLVSLGPAPRVTIPTVKTTTFTTAVATLKALTLTPTEKQQASTKPNGTVLAQTPPAKTSVKKHTHVLLTVSQQNAVAVPSVVGKTRAAAGNALGAVGLGIGNVITACSTQVPSGQVSKQTPAAATQVKPHSTVNLTVSSGACPVPVPTVLHKPAAAAKATLTGNGFTVTQTTVKATSTPGKCTAATTGKVVAQTPAGGKSEAKGSPVTITVCTAKAGNGGGGGGAGGANAGVIQPATAAKFTIPSSANSTRRQD